MHLIGSCRATVTTFGRTTDPWAVKQGRRLLGQLGRDLQAAVHRPQALAVTEF